MTREELVEEYATVDLETPPATHSTGLTVLSLCDGMSCGQIAFEKAGIKVDKYYASEIKECAINTTIHNFPNIRKRSWISDLHHLSTFFSM